MQQPYTPQRSPAGGDDYRCFILPWSADRTRYVTGFDVRSGRRRQVHHIIVYLARPSDAARVERWDAANPAPGYGCYGGPSACGAATPAVQLLAGWAPGSGGADFPPGRGVPVAPGSRLILQAHYNVEHARAAPDRSVVLLSVADSVERRGLYLPVVDVRWLFERPSFVVPAGARRVTHTFSGDPRVAGRLLAPDLDMTAGLTVHTVLLHMHRLGESGEIAVEHADGSREVLLSVARWDFDWQREYRLADPASLAPGDRMSIRCVHDNGRANQPVVAGRRGPPRTVTWGEDSSDEMCVGFVYVAEA